jgi:tetratricopeptide (TPR) repeat protein
VAVVGQASQPETAYVLAALDLAQPGPPRAAAVERLRLAAAADPHAGRARAALVYALAKSGDLSGARAELAKLDESAPSYPLLPDLHAWVGTGATVVLPAPPPVESAAPVSSESSPSTPPQAMGVAAAPAGESPHSSAAGPDRTLQAAGDAIGKGDLDRAERIYEGILAGNPNESQALAGLGDVLRMRHDPQGAIDAYKRAVAINPSYVPAVVGLGDTQWAEGDRASASRTYKSLVDHFPEGTYPGYVNQRAAQGR